MLNVRMVVERTNVFREARNCVVHLPHLCQHSCESEIAFLVSSELDSFPKCVLRSVISVKIYIEHIAKLSRRFRIPGMAPDCILKTTEIVFSAITVVITAALHNNPEIIPKCG